MGLDSVLSDTEMFHACRDGCIRNAKSSTTVSDFSVHTLQSRKLRLEEIHLLRWTEQHLYNLSPYLHESGCMFSPRDSSVTSDALVVGLGV